MKLSPIFARIAAITVLALAPGSVTMAKEGAEPPSDDVLYPRVALHSSSIVKIDSGIYGEVYVLTVKSLGHGPDRVTSGITINIGSTKYTVPETSFRPPDAFATTTPLFELKNKEVGFVTTYGDGERAKKRLFRINFKKRVVKWEDWSLYGDRILGKLEAQGTYQRLKKE